MIWFWFALAIIALIFELINGFLYFLVIFVAFTITGIYTYFFDANLPLSIAVASILSLSGIIIIAVWNKNKKQKESVPSDPQDLDVGQVVVIEELLPNGLYYVRYRGTQWEAASETPAESVNTGTKATIVGKDANTLIIKNH